MMRPTTAFLSVLAAILALSWASAARAQADEDRGLKLGSQAPAFNLQSPDGTSHSLEALLKKGNVALVFHRSADW